MTFAGWLLIAVLAIWGVIGPLLAYNARLACLGAPETPRDALRDVAVPHPAPAPPEPDWLPALPLWLLPAPTPETRTEGPSRTVWWVPIPEQPREILPVEFTDGGGTEAPRDPGTPSDAEATTVAPTPIGSDERLHDTPALRSLRRLFQEFRGDPILGGTA